MLPLLQGITDQSESGKQYLDVWMSHGDKVAPLPKRFELMAATYSAPIAGMFDIIMPFYALPFHPEVTHTVQEQCIIERFVHDICDFASLRVSDNISNDAVRRI